MFDKYEKIDYFLLKTVVIMLFIVVIAQFFLVYKPFNIRLSVVEKLEGEKVLLQNDINPAGDFSSEYNYISFRLTTPYIQSLPEAIILVNQKKVGDFKNLQCTIKVQKDDEVTIDATSYSLDLELKAVASKGLTVPKENIKISKGKKYSFFVH